MNLRKTSRLFSRSFRVRERDAEDENLHIFRERNSPLKLRLQSSDNLQRSLVSIPSFYWMKRKEHDIAKVWSNALNIWLKDEAEHQRPRKTRRSVNITRISINHAANYTVRVRWFLDLPLVLVYGDLFIREWNDMNRKQNNDSIPRRVYREELLCTDGKSNSRN